MVTEQAFVIATSVKFSRTTILISLRIIHQHASPMTKVCSHKIGWYVHFDTLWNTEVSKNRTREQLEHCSLFDHDYFVSKWNTDFVYLASSISKFLPILIGITSHQSHYISILLRKGKKKLSYYGKLVLTAGVVSPAELDN